MHKGESVEEKRNVDEGRERGGNEGKKGEGRREGEKWKERKRRAR